MVSANGMDRITMEAQNLARLEAGQTPLAGGENPMLHQSDFAGVTPSQNVAATPNPLLGMTPRGGETPGPGATGRMLTGFVLPHMALRTHHLRMQDSLHIFCSVIERL